MPIPQEFIDQVLDGTDLVKLIGARVELRRAGRDHIGLCPFHAEKTPSFTVSEAKRFYYCFGCRASGTAFDFLMKSQGMDFPAAVEELAARAGMQMPERTGGGGAEHRDREPLYAVLEEAADYYRQQLHRSQAEGAQRARAYLEARGISLELAQKFRLGYAPEGGRALLDRCGSGTSRTLAAAGLAIGRHGAYRDMFRGRLMFPIREWRRGRTVGFGARILDGNGPKYLNTPQTPVFHKGRELYGLHRVLHLGVPCERIYVVEGYMDAIGLAAGGIDNAVATLGTAVTRAQLQLLFRRCRHLVLCLDGDEAGRRAAVATMQTALPLLRPELTLEFMQLPQEMDPDEFARTRGSAAFEEPALRIGLPRFLLEQAAEGLDIGILEGRNALAHRAAGWLNALGDRVLRGLILEELAGRVGISAARLEEQLRAPERPPAAPPAARSRQRPDLQTPRLLSNAIALLLHAPAVAIEPAPEEPDLTTLLEIKGIEVLQRIVSLIRTQPGIRCAGILERFRDTPWEPRLRELAANPPLLSEQADLGQEFRDALQRLHEQHLRRRSRTLKMIERPSEAEQEELRMLEARLARVVTHHDEPAEGAGRHA